MFCLSQCRSERLTPDQLLNINAVIKSSNYMHTLQLLGNTISKEIFYLTLMIAELSVCVTCK